MKTPRRRARELAVQALYQAAVNSIPAAEAAKNIREMASPIERAVLLMACHELSAMPETPYPVIINEAIEVTKTFGGTDGHKFVNGILDRLAVQLRPNDPKRGA